MTVGAKTIFQAAFAVVALTCNAAVDCSVEERIAERYGRNLNHTAYLVQDGRRWDTYQCGRIDAKRPFEIVAEARVDAARAAKALDLLKPFEAKAGASWRWRMLFLRAKIDRGLSLGQAVDGPELKPLFAELARIYRISDTTEPFLTPPGPMIDPSRFHAGAL